MTSWSKNAITVAFGCSDRLRPSCPEADRRPERISSAGVCTAPPATITILARTVSFGQVRPPGRTKRQLTPVAAGPVRTTRSTRQSANSRAPSDSARGTLVTSIERFAPVGQPLLQLFVPAQCSWLRRFVGTFPPPASAPAPTHPPTPPTPSPARPPP